MTDPLDLSVPALPDDLHAEARTVAAHTRTAQDPFEVAVILATRGYTDLRARELGSPDVFDLAARIHPLLPMFTGHPDELPAGAKRKQAERPAGPERLSVGLLARSLLYSAPWLIAIAALVISRVSFWSTITTRQISSTISISLFLSLVVTGAFIQAFARRGVFYALQHNRELLDWTLRRTLLLGAAVLAVAVGIGYMLLEFVFRAYTPAATRSFVYFGLSIGLLLLAFAPLYLARAFWLILAAAGAGGAVAIVGGRLITHGQYINPYTAQKVQLLALGAAVVAALIGDWFVLRRLVASAPGSELEDISGHVRPPRLAAVARSVAPYASYGAGFFTLIIMDQLVAGGLRHGAFSYNGRYELAVGVGLLVLIPALTYGTAASELLPGTVQRALRVHHVGDARGLQRMLSNFYRRHLLITSLVGVAAALALFAAGSSLAATTSVTAGLGQVYGIYAGALVAYLLVAVGAFNSGMLFSLAAPRVPAATVWTGTLLSGAVGVGLSWLWTPEAGALTGLVCGSALFAIGTTLSARRLFDRFDVSYYRAF